MWRFDCCIKCIRLITLQDIFINPITRIIEVLNYIPLYTISSTLIVLSLLGFIVPTQLIHLVSEDPPPYTSIHIVESNVTLCGSRPIIHTRAIVYVVIGAPPLE